jgi:hypothetical protein
VYLSKEVENSTSVCISSRPGPACAFPAGEPIPEFAKLNAMTVAKRPISGGRRVHGRFLRIGDIDLEPKVDGEGCIFVRLLKQKLLPKCIK